MMNWSKRQGNVCDDVNVHCISDGDFFAYTRHEPVGICGQIIPVSLPIITLDFALIQITLAQSGENYTHTSHGGNKCI